MQRIHDRETVRGLAEKNGLVDIFGRHITDSMELRCYGDGEAVCSVGDRLEYLFVLVKGNLKIHTLLPNGKSMLVRFVRPMSIIGDVELLKQNPVRNQVESAGDSLVLLASRKRLLKEMETNAVMLRFLYGELSHKMYMLGQTSALNLLYPVENRFASYLLSLFADQEGGRFTEEIRTSTLTDTAELLGTSYRHLNRIVRRFIEEGMIERTNGRLRILDKGKLGELASESLYEY